VNSLIFSLLIGTGFGAALGYFGQCKSGACPLTANWKRGAVYGAVLGLLFHFSSGNGPSSYRSPKNLTVIGETNFDAEVLRAGKPVVVDFFAPWCGPCRILSPRLDQLAGEFTHEIKFVSVNVDQAPTLAAKYGVQGIPMLLFIGNDGKIVDTSVGLISVETLRAKLEALNKR
jgi:thioredoxin 1